MFSILTSTLILAVTTQAHMEMSWPPPFRSKYNPHANQNQIDYSMTAPLSGSAQFPCKGYASDMSETTGAGAPVVTWNAGSTYNMTIVGGAAHGGGSCQAALSYDSGKSFIVIHSYQGSCPTQGSGNFDFTVPADSTPGSALFAWTWMNQIGNREFYMNCASVNIASSSVKRDTSGVAFASRPGLFVANIGNGCTTVEGKDVSFPSAGPDVSGQGSGSGSLSGSCAASVSGTTGGASDSNSGSSHSGSVAASPTTGAETPSEATPRFMTLATPTKSSPAIPASTGDLYTPAVKASINGECGGSQTCTGSIFGSCCSKFGFCGSSAAHCGEGCVGAFGSCAKNSTGPSPTGRALLRQSRIMRV